MPLVIPFALFASLDDLEQKVKRDIEMLNYPTAPWRFEDESVLDVAIIGGGMAGTAVAFSLKLQGIENVQVFDENEKGLEGPWLTTARMQTLRSGKNLRGPAMGIPHLTCRAWYEAQFGEQAWNELGKIPTVLWGNYIQWLHKVLAISVESNSRLKEVIPNPNATLRLVFENGKEVHTRKLVLATGRSGFGGFELPDFVQNIPKQYWAHTGERISPEAVTGKSVCVLGVGASGFDAAAFALDHGATKVQMLMRRSELPIINHFASFAYPGFQNGYYYLHDKERLEIFAQASSAGVPPPIDSVKRVASHPDFEILGSIQIKEANIVGDAVDLVTNRGILTADFLMLATGYAVDGSKIEALSSFYDKVLLWKDQVPDIDPKLGRHPYLGPYFQFQGSEPFLGNIYCFNSGAFLSHGRISGDIDCIDVGVKRLVDGIAIALFIDDTRAFGEPTTNGCSGSCHADFGDYCCEIK
jgi:cation diffusion facilitator CzcD-associated flavoprotein CzcO